MKESIGLLVVGFAVFKILLTFALSAAIKRPARKMERETQRTS